MRADVFLVERGYAASRAEAQAAIRIGLVTADGAIIEKPSEQLSGEETIGYTKPHPYVSRGGLKLAAALDKFALSPKGLVCVDLGASTGGFTEVLLERGAIRVHAIDVGHGQLHPKLARDERVVASEGVNARDLSRTHVSEPFQFVVADVSFIGLRLALPPALQMAAPGAVLVALVKPQFEIGKARIGKGGVVRDEDVQSEAVADFAHWLSSAQGWTVLGTLESPVLGGDGNREFLVAARKP